MIRHDVGLFASRPRAEAVAANMRADGLDARVVPIGDRCGGHYRGWFTIRTTGDAYGLFSVPR